MTLDRGPAGIAQALLGTHATEATVLAIVEDAATLELLGKVLRSERLTTAHDLTEGLAVTAGDPPDVAFVELAVSGGAGLAMVHHLKALVPNVTVFALISRTGLEQGAHAMALGASGTLVLPLGGDEILSALSAVKLRLAERSARIELEKSALVYARAAGWLSRAAELADCSTRVAAAERLVEIVLEATSVAGAAVYLSAGEKSMELARAAASPALEGAPSFGLESDIFAHARREKLLAVSLSLRTFKAGHMLLKPSDDEANGPESISSFSARSAVARVDGLLKLLATQATTALALLAERERAGGSAMKDPASSAYSFAYYVDVAGREIDRARRYGRRFAIATVAFEPDASVTVLPADMIERLLKATRDTDVLARIDENEFHLLLPETDGLGAHACRRRILSRLAAEGGAISRGALVGVATFPHDGQDLSQLLRIARYRAEATKASIVHRLTQDHGSIGDLLDALEWDLQGEGGTHVSAPRLVELPTSETVALATTVVADTLRGGATFLAVAHHRSLSLGAAVKAAIGTPRDNVTLHVLEVKQQEEDIEALSVIGEHGAYAFIGRNQGGIVRGIHAADPLLADALAERLGKAAGLRVFS